MTDIVESTLPLLKEVLRLSELAVQTGDEKIFKEYKEKERELEARLLKILEGVNDRSPKESLKE